MVIMKTNNKLIFFSIFLIMLGLCICQKESKKSIKKPGKFMFSSIDLEFRFIEQYLKIGNKDLKSIKRLVNSVKSLIKSLIYTNLAKKKITLDKKVLDNLEIEYNNNEPLIHEPEVLNKNLIVLFAFGKLRTKLFKSTIFKENKSLMRSPDKKQCYLSLITISKTKYKNYLKIPNYFKMSLIKEIFYILGFRKPYFLKKKLHNNFNEVPYYLIQDLKSFNSYKKYLSFTD